MLCVVDAQKNRLKTNDKKDGQENIHNFTLKILTYWPMEFILQWICCLFQVCEGGSIGWICEWTFSAIYRFLHILRGCWGKSDTNSISELISKQMIGMSYVFSVPKILSIFH